VRRPGLRPPRPGAYRRRWNTGSRAAGARGSHPPAADLDGATTRHLAAPSGGQRFTRLPQVLGDRGIEAGGHGGRDSGSALADDLNQVAFLEAFLGEAVGDRDAPPGGLDLEAGREVIEQEDLGRCLDAFIERLTGHR
jgi:hypothetical protein